MRERNSAGIVKKYTMIIVLLLVTAFFAWRTNGAILLPMNVSSLISQNAYVFILATGMLLCILTGGNIDLSVGSVVCFVGAVGAVLMVNFHVNLLLTVLAMALVGIAIGAWQGVWIAYVRIPPFIVTLAGMLVFRGLSNVVLGGMTVSIKEKETFVELFGGGANCYIPDAFGGGGLNRTCLLAGVAAVAVYLLCQIRALRGRGEKNRGVEEMKRSMAKLDEARSTGTGEQKEEHEKMTGGTAPGKKKGHDQRAGTRSGRIREQHFQMGGSIVRLVLVSAAILAFSYRLAQHKGIPSVLIWVAVVVLTYGYITSNTVVGRHFYAVGGNEKATRLSGINTNRVYFLAYLNMGFLASLAGMVTIARMTSAQPTYGQSYEMDAIGACFIGGASAYGGIGTVPGVIVGAVLMGVINLGMSLMGVDQNMQKVVKGLVLLAAVIFDVVSKRGGRLTVRN